MSPLRLRSVPRIWSRVLVDGEWLHPVPNSLAAGPDQDRAPVSVGKNYRVTLNRGLTGPRSAQKSTKDVDKSGRTAFVCAGEYKKGVGAFGAPTPFGNKYADTVLSHCRYC